MLAVAALLVKKKFMLGRRIGFGALAHEEEQKLLRAHVRLTQAVPLLKPLTLPLTFALTSLMRPTAKG